MGLSAESVAGQGGFRTPLPGWNAGGTAAIEQGGFRGLMGFWIGGAAAGEAFVETTTDPSGPKPAPYLDEDEEEILILMAAAEYYGLFK